MKAFWVLGFLLCGAVLLHPLDGVWAKRSSGNAFELPDAPKAKTVCNDAVAFVMTPCIVRNGYFWCSHGKIIDTENGNGS